jgi:hypothetical protein
MFVIAAAMNAVVATAPAAAAPTPPPPPLNLVLNGDFETGAVNHWHCEDSRVWPHSSAGGTWALETVTSTNSTGRCWQTVAVRPNSTYELSGLVRGQFVFLGVTNLAATGTRAATAWTPVSTTFRTDSTTDTVEVYFHGWYDQWRYDVDDITLRGPSPAPPATPSGVVVTGSAARWVDLAWNPVLGAAD